MLPRSHVLPRSLKGLLLLNQGALVVLVVLAGLLGAVWAAHWQSASREAVRINALLQGAQQVRGDMYRQLQEVVRARLTENTESLHVYSVYAERIVKQFEGLTALAADREESLAVDYMRQTYEVVHEDMEKVFSSPYVASDAARMKLLDPAYEEWMVGDFESAMRVFTEIVAVRQRNLEASVASWNRAAAALLPVPIVLAIVLLFVSWRVLRRRFIEPIGALVEGARHFSRGELSHRIVDSGVSETRTLASSFNDMASELSASRGALVEAERQAALGALVPVVAHNIRNPLASIRATAQIVDEHSDVQELGEARTAIIDSVDRLGRWVGALLNYLHPLEPKLERSSLARAADGALALLAPRLREKQIEVQRHGWEQASPCVLDPDLVEQALYGLLSNALEASPRGGVIDLSLEDGERLAALHIDDRGSGIGFEPNPADLTPGPTTKPLGTGLGIPFAFKVFQAHGGEVHIRANANATGSRATVELPMADVELSGEAAV
ncbi:MAG: HAMP domain-containing protein [Gammaproteobacteria bacterium]